MGSAVPPSITGREHCRHLGFARCARAVGDGARGMSARGVFVARSQTLVMLPLHTGLLFVQYLLLGGGRKVIHAIGPFVECKTCGG